MPTLNWIGKKAVENHHRQVPFRLLKDVPELSAGDSDTGNLILEGDNLVALKALLPYYAGQVKCIYIDPPYNTGNENWVYNDNVTSPEMKEWLGKVVGKENDDLCRHDKWLCMMYSRLSLLRKLLSEDGIIFISIGRDELSNLTALCDEIFDRRNQIEILIWNTHGHTENQEDITGVHEYVLLYAKDKNKAKIRTIVDPSVPGDSKIRRDFAENSITKNGPKNPASIINLPIGFPCEVASLEMRPLETFTAFKEEVEKKGFINRELTTKFDVKYPVRQDFMSVSGNRLTKECRVYSGWMSADKLRDFIKEGCAPIDDEGTKLSFYLSKNGVVYYRREGRKSHYVQSVLTELGTTETNKYMLEAMGVNFDYPKPVELITYLCSLYTNSDDIVLDAFAGSGTTGHAVLQLNKQDTTNRKFILVEMDQTIARSITSVRVKRVISGYKNSKNETIAGLGGGFRYCQLADPLFDEKGNIRSTVRFHDLARHVFFTETGAPLPKGAKANSPLIGLYNDTAIYLLYNGILKDKAPDGGNVLTTAILAHLPKHAGPKVVYGNACRIGQTRLNRENITFKQLPYKLKVGAL